MFAFDAYEGMEKHLQSLQEEGRGGGGGYCETCSHLYSYGGTEDLNKAMNFAFASSEVLFRSRIFDKDVLENTTWTEDDQGVDLPDHFFRPKKHQTRGGWLERLVWDPRDSFATMDEKVRAREDQLERSRRAPCW